MTDILPNFQVEEPIPKSAHTTKVFADQLNTYMCHIPTRIKVVDYNGSYKNNDTVSYDEFSSLERSSMDSDDSLNLSHASYKKNLIIKTNIKKSFHYDNYTYKKDEGILLMKKGLYDSWDL